MAELPKPCVLLTVYTYRGSPASLLSSPSTQDQYSAIQPAATETQRDQQFSSVGQGISARDRERDHQLSPSRPWCGKSSGRGSPRIQHDLVQTSHAAAASGSRTRPAQTFISMTATDNSLLRNQYAPSVLRSHPGNGGGGGAARLCSVSGAAL